MVKGHHLQLRWPLPFFCNFTQFNFEATITHQPIIQKELDELLAKGAIEWLTGDDGFYSIVFVVHKHTGGLKSKPDPKWFLLPYTHSYF